MLQLETVLGLIQVIAVIVILASGNIDVGTKSLCTFIFLLGVALALAPIVTVIGELLTSRAGQVLMIIDGVLGIIAMVRVPNRMLAAVICLTGVLMAAHACTVLGGWHF